MTNGAVTANGAGDHRDILVDHGIGIDPRTDQRGLRVDLDWAAEQQVAANYGGGGDVETMLF